MKRLAIFTLFIILLIIVLSFFHFRGIFYPDEGYILNTAKRIADGQSLYSDFDFVYTPVTPLLTLLGFSVFGESILSVRIIALTITLTVIFSLSTLGKLATPKLIPVITVILLYISWGPTHINFLWPSIIAINIGIITLLFFMYGVKKESKQLLIISGIFAFIVFLTKQNLGIAAMLSFYVFILLQKEWRTGVSVTYGILIALGSFATYLVATNAFFPFLRNFYDNLILKILVEKTIDTPLLQGSFPYSIIKFGFYFLPLAISIAAMIICMKKKSLLLILPLSSMFFFLAGFRPVTDYVHLSPLLAMMGLSILPILSLSKNMLLTRSLYVVSIFYILVGLYTSLFLGYYRWETALSEKHTFLTHPRVNIWVTDRYHTEITQLTNIINEKTAQDEAVFINYYAPMIYFLIDRPNPTSYDYLSEYALTNNARRELLNTLDTKDVEVVITHDLNQYPQEFVNRYIKANYIKEKQINEFTIWGKKNPNKTHRP